ncbi:MAG: hypothetical protein ACRDRT_15360, partial [Pseudonocardiaceae bacterium]
STQSWAPPATVAASPTPRYEAPLSAPAIKFQSATDNAPSTSAEQAEIPAAGNALLNRLRRRNALSTEAEVPVDAVVSADGDDTATPPGDAMTAPDRDGESPAIEFAESSDGFPIADYDNLRATAIVGRLAGLSADDLGKIRAFEAAHKNRFSVMSRLDSELDVLTPPTPVAAPAVKAPAKRAAPTRARATKASSPAKKAPARKAAARPAVTPVPPPPAIPTPLAMPAAPSVALSKKTTAAKKATAAKSVAAKAPTTRVVAPSPIPTRPSPSAVKKSSAAKKVTPTKSVPAKVPVKRVAAASKATATESAPPVKKAAATVKKSAVTVKKSAVTVKKSAVTVKKSAAAKAVPAKKAATKRS